MIFYYPHPHEFGSFSKIRWYSSLTAFYLMNDSLILGVVLQNKIPERDSFTAK